MSKEKNKPKVVKVKDSKIVDKAVKEKDVKVTKEPATKESKTVELKEVESEVEVEVKVEVESETVCKFKQLVDYVVNADSIKPYDASQCMNARYSLLRTILDNIDEVDLSKELFEVPSLDITVGGEKGLEEWTPGTFRESESKEDFVSILNIIALKHRGKTLDKSTITKNIRPLI